MQEQELLTVGDIYEIFEYEQMFPNWRPTDSDNLDQLIPMRSCWMDYPIWRD